jgi:hypothetical protein
MVSPDVKSASALYRTLDQTGVLLSRPAIPGAVLRGYFESSLSYLTSNQPGIPAHELLHDYGIISPGHLVIQMVKQAINLAEKQQYGQALAPLSQAKKVLIKPFEEVGIPASQGASSPCAVPFIMEIPRSWLTGTDAGERFREGLGFLEDALDDRTPMNLQHIRALKEMQTAVAGCYEKQQLNPERVNTAPYARDLIKHLLASTYIDVTARLGEAFPEYSPVILKLQLVRGLMVYNESAELRRISGEPGNGEQPLVLDIPEQLRLILKPRMVLPNMRNLELYRREKSGQGS